MDSLNSKRILVFGTFDLLHEGHSNFFQQARDLSENPYLIVSIARDVNVERIKNQAPHLSEIQRLENVRNHELIDQAELGALDDYISHILELRPEIIALGYDQEHYTEGLEQKLLDQGLKVEVVRLQAYKPEQYKSSIIKKLMGLVK